MADRHLVDAQVDYGNIHGFFVRVDVEFPPDAVYSVGSDEHGPAGWIVLTPDEAESLAAVLNQRAQEVRAQSA